jgi:hypothetical protein
MATAAQQMGTSSAATSAEEPPARIKPDPYTFIDEMWELHTVDPTRVCSRREDGNLVPGRPAPMFVVGVPDIEPRTMKQKAAHEDRELWESCFSFEDYNAKRQILYESHKYARMSWLESQGTFHPFPRLPSELRLRIWSFAMTAATEVKIMCSGYTINRPQGWCGTVSSRPRIYAATAFLPPLMLVNHESHSAASKHYRRAFRGVDGGGGVLAAYPTSITIDESAFHLVRDDDFGIVQKVVLETTRGLHHSRGTNDQFRTLLANQNLKEVEIRMRKAGLRWLSGLYIDLQEVYSQLRERNAEWVAPEIRLISVAEKEEDDMVYYFEGGLLETMNIPEIESA